MTVVVVMVMTMMVAVLGSVCGARRLSLSLSLFQLLRLWMLSSVAAPPTWVQGLGFRI
jgi:hypothetical protein